MASPQRNSGLSPGHNWWGMLSRHREVVVSIAMIIGGCVLNNVVLELMVMQDSGCGNIITLAQFAFVAVEGLLQHIELDRSTYSLSLKRRVIPLSYYCLLVAMFFTLSVLNNMAFGYRISLPLHMIFRSGSLAMNLLVGVLFFGKRHSMGEYLSVFSISVGIFAATYLSASSSSSHSAQPTEGAFTEQMVGVTLLVVALVLSSVLGHLQEYAYRKYGKAWRENMFYSHALSLPLFVVMASDIGKRAEIFNASPALPFLPLPSMWVYLILNLITQYICIQGVYRLIGATSSLTGTLVITLRKFVSILISVLYFKNSFSFYHWLATLLVFGGSIVYTMASAKNAKEAKTKE